MVVDGDVCLSRLIRVVSILVKPRLEFGTALFETTAGLHLLADRLVIVTPQITWSLQDHQKTFVLDYLILLRVNLGLDFVFYFHGWFLVMVFVLVDN